MNFHCLKLLAVNLVLCAAATGQVNDLAVFRTTNNFNDLNASRDAIGMTPGDIRITHTITDGSDPISFDFLTSDIYLQVISRVDGWTNFYRAAFETNELATVRWRVIGIQRGEYVLYSEITTGGETYPIFWRNLTVTQSVSSAESIGTINLTYVTGGIVSNVTESTSNKWDAATGGLIINTNPTASGGGDLSALSNAVITGIQAPYTNSPASPITLSAANGWWQTLTTTGTTEILIADKPATNNGASVRLDLWTLHATTITNIEGYASLAISTSAVNVLLFDNPADRGITNWYVEQLYP